MSPNPGSILQLDYPNMSNLVLNLVQKVQDKAPGYRTLSIHTVHRVSGYVLVFVRL